MIVDALRNAILYRGLSPRIALAFDYLRNTDFRSVASGTFEIAGRDLYAIVQEYTTMGRTLGVWEAHRQYIDLQYVVSGTELIGYTHLGRLRPGRYDEARDLLPLAGAEAGAFLTCGPGDFMLLFPEDAHMPRIAVAAPAKVRKVVVKIAVSP
jgi:YhcH/YjgK/YiaL family protein